MASKSAKRLTNEFKSLTTTPVCNSKVTQEDSLYKWKVVLPGPKGSAYEDGSFTLSFVFPENYPFKCPDVKFTTPMYHPNVKKKPVKFVWMFSLIAGLQLKKLVI